MHGGQMHLDETIMLLILGVEHLLVFQWGTLPMLAFKDMLDTLVR